MKFRINQIMISFVLGLGLLVMILLPVTSRPVQAAPGDRYCVLPPGKPTGVFSGCDQVFTSIQAAVDMAGGGEMILVAGGIYTEVNQRAGLSQMVYLSQTVTIQGGYIPPFTAAPDPLAQPSILDAQGQGRVLYISGASGTGGEISPTIMGLHLTGGNATDLGGGTGDDAGGGVYIVEATVTLSGNVIYKNTASESQVGYGGGVYLTTAEALVAGNTIHHNLASRVDKGSGGGLVAEQSHMVINDNTIFSNTASLREFASGVTSGGGIYINDSFASVNRNMIMSNTAVISGYYTSGNGGGIFLDGEQPMILSHNLIQGNVAKGLGSGDGFGGGVYIRASAPITLQDNLILDNIAAISGVISVGGGLYGNFSQGELVLNHNRIQNNIAAVSAYIGAGGGLILEGRVRLSHNTIISNTALISGLNLSTNTDILGGFGGGLYIGRSQASLEGDIIQANVASHSDNGSGGGLYLEASEASLTNAVLSDNWATRTGSGMTIGGGSDVELIHITMARNQGGDGSGLHLNDYTTNDTYAPSSLALTNAIVSNQTIGIRVTGNTTATVNGILWYTTPVTVSASPTATVSIRQQFKGSPIFAGDGYHILPGSQAIDRGVLAGVLVDIDAEARSDTPDLGADEYAGSIYETYLPLIVRQ